MNLRTYILFIAFCIISTVSSQEARLPVDFRQHNVLQYNANLMSPGFSVDWNQPASLALWSRWQWQTVDGNPTTLFLNYTGRFKENAAFGVGFFQHNTGVFLNTGGILNYAHAFNVGGDAKITLGINVFGYQQELADDLFIPSPIDPIQPDIVGDFILQVAPAIHFTSENLTIALTSENFFVHNFGTNESQSGNNNKIFTGLLGYEYPLTIFGSSENTFVRPSVYFKSIPGLDGQFGINTLFSTSKFWAQGGYNSFYGISGGAGVRLFNHISLGAAVEFGIDPDVTDKDPTFELFTAYTFGKREKRKRVKKEPKDEDLEQESVEEEIVKSTEEQTKDALAEAEALAEAKRTKEAERKAEIEIQRKDSLRAIERAKEAEITKIREEKRRIDSITNATTVEAEKKAAALKEKNEKEAAKPTTQGRYEEVANEDGLTPGYYLIANVFGTQKYFDKFVLSLKNKGLKPKSFFRKLNGYNYVYLERYDTLLAAEKARDSQFNGAYSDELWIYRVLDD